MRPNHPPKRWNSAKGRIVGNSVDEMAWGEGLEPPLPDPKSGVLPLDDPQVAWREGLEPPFPESESGVLPLDDLQTQKEHAGTWRDKKALGRHVRVLSLKVCRKLWG